LAKAVFAVTAVVVALLAATWLGVHTIAPRTAPGDLVGLLQAPDAGPESLEAMIANNERINVLLLAYGGAGHDNPSFTDSMLLVSIRPATALTTVISFPRNLLVDIPAPEHGSVPGELYSAYALGTRQDNPQLGRRWRTSTGAGDLAAATVSVLTGERIDYWVAVDSAAFKAVIDAVGGVRVTVPETLDDSNYPVEDSDRTMHIHFDRGPQLLNGERALEYARSRRSTSETDRSRRQELVLVGLASSLHQFHVTPGLLLEIGPLEQGLRTNLRPLEMQDLERLAARIDPALVRRLTLEDSGLLEAQALAGGNYVLVPRGGDYAGLRAYASDQLP
jgi:LCP family protein required for cell wall assembly